MLKLLCLIAAAVCFFLKFINVNVANLDMLAGDLFFVVLSMIV
jgi:hypothetical protein